MRLRLRPTDTLRLYSNIVPQSDQNIKQTQTDTKRKSKLIVLWNQSLSIPTVAILLISLP